MTTYSLKVMLRDQADIACRRQSQFPVLLITAKLWCYSIHNHFESQPILSLLAQCVEVTEWKQTCSCVFNRYTNKYVLINMLWVHETCYLSAESTAPCLQQVYSPARSRQSAQLLTHQFSVFGWSQAMYIAPHLATARQVLTKIRAYYLVNNDPTGWRSWKWVAKPTKSILNSKWTS
jgi:hypothetical protein